MADKIAIVSGKGGAGKSTAAVLLGQSLVADGKRVLLVDADTGLNSLDILTGSVKTNVYNWGDALMGRCAPDACLTSCDAGFDLLSAPCENTDLYTPEKFAELICGYDHAYDFILIDGPAGIGDGMHLAAAPATKALILSAPDDVSVSGCARAAEKVCASGPKQARLIINHFRFKAVKKCNQINIDNVIDRSGVRLIGIIPEDKNLWYFGSGGKLLKRSSPATDACDRIAGRLQGQRIPLNLSYLK